MKKIIFRILLTCLSLNIYAGDTGDKGNGGDSCENRILVIREDIKKWILNGGAYILKLPKSIKAKKYEVAMLDMIKKAKISCTQDKLFILDAEKTCKNFTSFISNQKIVCNFSRFNQTSEEEQYKFIHHEFAGLANIEVNNGKNRISLFYYKSSNNIS